jgi:hypothetical protein
MKPIYFIIGFFALVLIIFLPSLFKKNKKEGFSPNYRPLVSTQDNCQRCGVKYQKTSHNNRLNSDGQIIV